MKMKVLKVVFVAAIAMVAGINLLNAQKPEVLSDVAMANVEALADSEMIVEECEYYPGDECYSLIITPSENYITVLFDHRHKVILK